jgi:2',3'-cyclic-nucleotide 2'-phosphodiesterase (5'-nucleotidase family)
MSAQPDPLRRLVDAIQHLAAKDDLAAVILHLNDTYQIEARPPDIPGMSRLATAVNRITDLVKEATGEDRTLVVHSGDFLSPSFMTTRLGFAGKQVVELLNCCGVDYATIGNHEFDVTPDQLKERLTEASFAMLCANLIAPEGLPALGTLEYWPRERPFLALSGLAGRQTTKKATKPEFGYRVIDCEAALKQVLEQVQSRSEIGALVLLTHMDRDEDKATQRILGLHWRKGGAAFVLGGHDHDISWQEPGWNSVLAKNLSNCRTVTAVVLSKSAAAAPASLPRCRSRSRRDMMKIERTWRTLEEDWDSTSLPVGALPFQAIVDRTLDLWRRSAPPNLRADFKEAFAAHLAETAATLSRSLVEKEDYLQGAERLIFDRAVSFELERFRFASSEAGILSLDGKSELGQLTPESSADKAVQRWIQEMEAEAGVAGREVLIDFSGHLPPGERLNGQDDALRARSTDFGNFAADAVEVATGADIAMLNAGAFRLDDMVGPSITRRDLQETFLYDHERAVVVVELTTDEVLAMCAHAQQKSGQGAFLQVSQGFEGISARTGSLRVALVRHMIADDEDGYQSLLASSRQCTLEQVLQHLVPGAAGGLIDLVSRGARSGVTYSAANRLAGSTGDHRLARDSFVKSVDRYLVICRTLGSDAEALPLLELVPSREPVQSRIAYERLLVRALVTQLAFTFGLEWLRNEFYDELEESDLQYRRGVDYRAYLDKAMTYYDFHIRHPRLRDEEGQSELPDATVVSPNIRPHRASKVVRSNTEKVALWFADHVDEYVRICGSHQMGHPACMQLIKADPQRNPPIEPISDARWRLRFALLMILVDWGLERVRSDLFAELSALNGRGGTNIRYDEYLESALTYFDIFTRYGLLLNDEAESAPSAN